ncbi:outer membrane beta-barrel protein [Pseudomaricurvus sp. HS19]|uniref:outer membrane beta-barrel protein n=1 Tax=Pseudomaricurvus sp. HS19 TaxID=2692626 RepID=UPI00136FB294|nr:outer membrane beta-barrel protein [Pseudomaricurvus sp. HS19]MYM65126.1 outer membrane beta-barrel protein [Pseudomaricurvus sp. HS19]
MSKSVFARSLLAVAVSASASGAMALDPAPVKAGVFEIVPTLALEQRYDDNIFSQPTDEQESWVTVLTPSVEATADLDTVELSALYEHSSGLYEASSDDNYSDNRVEAGVSWELNHRNQFDLTASYFDGHEDRGTGFTQGAAAGAIEEPDTYDEVAVDGKYTYGSETSKGRLELAVGSYEKQYTNHRDLTRGRDRDALKASGTFFWRVGGKTDLLAEVRQADNDYVYDPAEVTGSYDTLDNTSTKYFVGVTWEATGKTTGSVKVGQGKKNFDDADRDDFSGASWEVGVTWQPKEYSALSVNTAREDRETDGAGNFIDAKTYGVNWQHGWTDRFTSTLFYSFDDSTYEGDASGREDETTTYGLRVDYSMRRWLDLGLSITETNKDSNFGQFEYDREQVALHATISL